MALRAELKAFGVAIALRSRQIADDVNQDFIRRFKAERGRVANIELEDFCCLLLPVAGLFCELGREYRSKRDPVWMILGNFSMMCVP